MFFIRNCLSGKVSIVLIFFSNFCCDDLVGIHLILCPYSHRTPKPFIKTQITRSDIDHSLFHDEHVIKDAVPLDDDDEED